MRACLAASQVPTLSACKDPYACFEKNGDQKFPQELQQSELSQILRTHVEEGESVAPQHCAPTSACVHQQPLPPTTDKDTLTRTDRDTNKDTHRLTQR